MANEAKRNGTRMWWLSGLALGFVSGMIWVLLHKSSIDTENAAGLRHFLKKDKIADSIAQGKAAARHRLKELD